MMVDITYQMVLSTLQTVGLLVGIYYYIMSLRNQQKNQELTLKSQDSATETRKIQIANDVIAKLSIPEFYPAWMDVVYRQPYTDFKDWLEKYGPHSNMDAYINFVYIAENYDMAGLVHRHGLVDPTYSDGGSIFPVSVW